MPCVGAQVSVTNSSNVSRPPSSEPRTPSSLRRETSTSNRSASPLRPKLRDRFRSPSRYRTAHFVPLRCTLTTSPTLRRPPSAAADLRKRGRQRLPSLRDATCLPRLVTLAMHPHTDRFRRDQPPGTT